VKGRSAAVIGLLMILLIGSPIPSHAAIVFGPNSSWASVDFFLGMQLRDGRVSNYQIFVVEAVLETLRSG
jgi:hypothetical protein